jgi:hypothetical protein
MSCRQLISRRIILPLLNVTDEAELPTVKTQVQLTSRARKVLDALKDDTGIPQTEAIARVFEWFSAQDRKLRVAILHRDENTQAEMMRLVLQQATGAEGLSKHDVPGGVNPDQAAAMIAALAGRMAETDASRLDYIDTLLAQIADLEKQQAGTKKPKR